MLGRRSNRFSKLRGSGLISSLADTAGKVINRAIDILPVELHLPTYQWCGPGSDVKKRLARGDPGINKLDAACKNHDITYYNTGDTKKRAEADRVLADKAWERVKASDSSLSEKAAAWAITNIMKVKSKLGGGGRVKKRRSCKTCCRKKNRNCRKKQNKKVSVRRKKGRGLYLRPYTGSGHQKKKNIRQ